MADGTPKDTPAWYAVTYHLQRDGSRVSTKLKTTPDAFWDELTAAYQGDQLIILDGAWPRGAFPARQILTVELRPCLPHEMPPEE